MPSDETHPLFQRNVAASRVGVDIVARWFESRGIKAEVEPMTISPTWADRLNHTDSGDIYIERTVNGEPRRLRIEVKHCTKSFTGAEDWPFRFFPEAIRYIVCDCHTWDSADPKPYAIICLSQDGTHVGIVHGANHEKWHKSECRNGQYGDVKWKYYSPLEDVTWVRIAEG